MTRPFAVFENPFSPVLSLFQLCQKLLSVNVPHIPLNKRELLLLTPFNVEEMLQQDILNLMVLWLDVGLKQVKIGQMEQKVIVNGLVLAEKLSIPKLRRNYILGL